MHKYFVLLIVVFLAACSAQSPTDVPFYTVTPRPLDEIPTRDSSFAGTDLPLDFAAGNPQIMEGMGSFNFAISGAFIALHDTGTVVYSQVPSMGDMPAHEQLYLAASDNNATQQISFEFASNLPAGQYPLVAPEDFLLGTVSAQYQRLASGDSGVVLESYAEEVNGVLVLRDVGETISGNFQFTAAYIQNSPEGEIQTQRIEVTGEFENVPYRVVGSDPFEVIVPLPTRIFSGTEIPVSTGQP